MRRNGVALLATLVLLLAAAMFGSLLIGAYPVPACTVLRIAGGALLPGVLPNAAGTATEQIVVETIRLPRIMLSSLAGFGLGLAGAALQGVMRNPLVGPDLVGVSGGAACGGVLAILFGLSGASLIVLALAGGLLALVAALALSRLAPDRGAGTLSLVLAGLVVSGFCAALINLAHYLADPRRGLQEIVYWLLGSFVGADRTKVALLAAPVVLAGGALVGLRWRLNLLALGEADAAALGVGVRRLRWTLIVLAAAMVSTQVAVSGIVGWVGLVVPHVARLVVGPDHQRLLPAAGVMGALFLLLVDDAARSLGAQELPIGLLTSLLGTPAFAVLLWRSRARGWRDG